jgi:hypothetical protein
LSSYYKQKRKQQQDKAEKESIAVVCNHADSHEFEQNNMPSYFTQGY